MRLSIPSACALALIMAGCVPGRSIQQQSEDRAEVQSPQQIVGGEEAQLSVLTSTVIDTGTGCQYTVRTIFQKGADIQPRNEAPGRQICQGGRAGSNVLQMKDGEIESVHNSVTRDRITGCEEIVGTLYQAAVFATPRMEAVGEKKQQICRKTA